VLPELIEKLCADLSDICAGLEFSAFVHVKNIASILGQFISMSPSCGNVLQIMTRYLLPILGKRGIPLFACTIKMEFLF